MRQDEAQGADLLRGDSMTLKEEEKQDDLESYQSSIPNPTIKICDDEPKLQSQFRVQLYRSCIDGELYDARVFHCPNCKHATLEYFAEHGGVHNLNEFVENQWYCKYCYTYFDQQGKEAHNDVEES